MSTSCASLRHYYQSYQSYQSYCATISATTLSPTTSDTSSSSELSKTQQARHKLLFGVEQDTLSQTQAPLRSRARPRPMTSIRAIHQLQTFDLRLSIHHEDTVANPSSLAFPDWTPCIAPVNNAADPPHGHHTNTHTLRRFCIPIHRPRPRSALMPSATTSLSGANSLPFRSRAPVRFSPLLPRETSQGKARGKPSGCPWRRGRGRCGSHRGRTWMGGLDEAEGRGEREVRASKNGGFDPHPA
ncbi:hypothetical protein BDZ90DRAFT_140481 [Jaminaea rosea]|uniref:Uncharacterized protein n=1 Tax=Jaminaea rosea TaxID=1569628 RepID=A0A316UWJ0_9BASI|nr:hypothetical protein BDZ90DRAFT_140481 [Jaminaea rosea]PWN29168.1 hypothetical protein BDZ90DRAFT_140481 [Jaminaea rosea]